MRLNQNRIRIKGEEAQPPSNIVPFPAAHSADTADPVFSPQAVSEVAQQVAAILKLPLTDDLVRVVADYLGRPGLSLLGEADAAIEWIGDARRNRKRQPMTPAFFRRWLKRETARPSVATPGRAGTNNTGVPPALARLVANGTGPPEVDNPYHTFVQQRAAQLTERAPSNTKDSEHETHS